MFSYVCSHAPSFTLTFAFRIPYFVAYIRQNSPSVSRGEAVRMGCFHVAVYSITSPSSVGLSPSTPGALGGRFLSLEIFAIRGNVRIRLCAFLTGGSPTKKIALDDNGFKRAKLASKLRPIAYLCEKQRKSALAPVLATLALPRQQKKQPSFDDCFLVREAGLESELCQPTCRPEPWSSGVSIPPKPTWLRRGHR